MFCDICGTQIDDDSVTCVNCGSSTNVENSIGKAKKQLELQEKAQANSIKKRKIIFACTLIAFIVIGSLTAGAIWAVKNSELPYNSNSINTLEKIVNARGNIVGNINNYGFYAQQGEWIFYTDFNKADNSYHLFKIRTDGTQKTKISDDSCQFINVVGDWIYYEERQSGYTSSYTLTKIRTDGTNRTILDDGDTYDYLNVVGDWIYYANIDGKDFKIYKIRTDGKRKTTVGDDKAFYLNVVDGWVYYSNLSDEGKLYKIRTDGSERTKLSDDVIYEINVDGGWVYFCKTDGNMIYKIRTDGTERTRLNDESSYFINVVDDWIYYSKYSHKGPDAIITGGPIYRIRTDGTKRTKLNNDNCTSVYYIDGWIYYEKHINVENNIQLKMRLDGTERQLLKY